MKIAVVYNRQSKRVINYFGVPNRERYALKSIKRITDALEDGGHQVKAFEGDKDLIDQLESFMPQVVKGERPGMVFNLSYGIQGQARYTHVPGMLEMIGLPYVGSGPLAHSLALDKIVSKMLFVQNGLPTPAFAVLEEPGFASPDLEFPLIVKPKNEAVSFGLKIVNNDKELREGAQAIFDEFRQPVLVESYIEGREINVGILGNDPPVALPAAELLFGTGGPNIYTYADKTHESGRTVTVQCPAKLDAALTEQAHHLARRAFQVLGCFDCARVDMRLDSQNNLYILEINSLPSLGEHGSYVEGALRAGLDFSALVNRLVEVAAARYFGTPSPPDLGAKTTSSKKKIFNYVTEKRDQLERQVETWTARRGHSSEPVGLQAAFETLNTEFQEVGLKVAERLTDRRTVWTWQSPAGFENGTLVIGHLDVPVTTDAGFQMFRREPEWLYGEGIGCSRAPLASLQFALRALRFARRLNRVPIGVLYYGDEGRDCRYSTEMIAAAAAKAKRVIVLRPGSVGDQMVVGRRGQRRYMLTVDGPPIRVGKPSKNTDVLRWLFPRLEACANLSNRKERIGVATLDTKTAHLPLLLPHNVQAMLLLTYPDSKVVKKTEDAIRAILGKGATWRLDLVSDRPPMQERSANNALLKELTSVAVEWEIPLARETSLWPSVAGLVPRTTGVVCGAGPVARDLYTPHESVHRGSLLQRTLLLAEFLDQQVP